MTHITNALLALTLSLTLSSVSADTQPPATAATQASDSSASSAPAPQPGDYSNISNAQLQTMIDDGVVVIDIRLEEEWRETGIIEGAIPITFFDDKGQINPQFVPTFTETVKPDQAVALICHSGNRSQFASKAIAQQLGYTKVFNVTHGINGWLSEKRPVIAYQ